MYNFKSTRSNMKVKYGNQLQQVHFFYQRFVIRVTECQTSNNSFHRFKMLVEECCAIHNRWDGYGHNSFGDIAYYK